MWKNSYATRQAFRGLFSAKKITNSTGMAYIRGGQNEVRGKSQMRKAQVARKEWHSVRLNSHRLNANGALKDPVKKWDS
jgi:hypothetical protein